MMSTMSGGSDYGQPPSRRSSARPSPSPSTAAPTSRQRSRTESGAVPQLSCNSCRDRKLKCDRLVPCGNCSLSNIQCEPVYRQRLPRGRHAQRCSNAGRQSPATGSVGTRPTTMSSGSRAQASDVASVAASATNSELGERVRRLESFINGLNSTATSGRSTPLVTSRVENPPRAGASPPDLVFDNSDSKSTVSIVSSPNIWASRFVSLDIDEENMEMVSIHSSDQLESVRTPWSRIQMNMDRVESTLDDIRMDSSVPILDPALLEPQDYDGVSLLGMPGPSKSKTMPGSRPHAVFGSAENPPTAQLCQVYLQNVDPIIKILHRPSLSRWMLHSERYLHYPPGHPSVSALSAAVCYTASVSVSESQCQALFPWHGSRANLISTCRAAVETAISSCGLLTSDDITALQAFVLYLIGRRTQDKSTAVWTLVAVAVRIAKAQQLHSDSSTCTTTIPLSCASPPTSTFFNQQIRARLWLTICLLDLQASIAQSTEPLVTHAEAAAALRHVQHVNDTDFGPDMGERVVPDREGLTDTTFALVTYQVQLAGRLLSFNTPDQGGREQHVRRFEQAALSLLHFCDPETSNYAWFTWHSTQCLVAAVRFAALTAQPGPKMGDSSSLTSPLSTPNSASRPSPDHELLRRVLAYLHKVQLMHTDPRSARYRWYLTMPWPALAAAITGCATILSRGTPTLLAANAPTMDDPADLARRAWPLVEGWWRLYERSGEMSPSARAELEPAVKMVGDKLEKEVQDSRLHEVPGVMSTAYQDPVSASRPGPRSAFPRREEHSGDQGFDLLPNHSGGVAGHSFSQGVWDDASIL